MDYIILQKIIYSVVILLGINLVFHILKLTAKKTQQKFGIRKSRYFAIKRLFTILSLLLSVLVLVFVWEVSLKNVWISATGILSLIAIAFFAVWSLVGNILAGIIIYFTSPFKIDDTIEVMPDEIRGTVLAINTFYTVLHDKNKNYINIPNSLLFQKYIKVIKTPKVEVPPAKDGASV